MRLRTKLFQAYLRQEIGFFDTHESGKLLSRLNHDTQIMSSIVANNIAQCISGFVKFSKMFLSDDDYSSPLLFFFPLQSVHWQ